MADQYFRGIRCIILMLQAVLSDCNAVITEALPEPRVLPVLLRTNIQNHHGLHQQQQLLIDAEVLLLVYCCLDRVCPLGGPTLVDVVWCVQVDEEQISGTDANAENVPLGHIAM